MQSKVTANHQNTKELPQYLTVDNNLYLSFSNKSKLIIAFLVTNEQLIGDF